MSVNVKAGQFAKTSSSPVSITGLGFQPKFLMMWTVDAGSSGNPGGQYTGYIPVYRPSIGFATTSGGHSISAGSVDNAATMLVAGAQSSGHILRVVDGDAAVDYDFTLNTFDVDGFTIVPGAVASPQPAFIQYIAIGGTAITAKQGIISMQKTPGQQIVSGVGFSGDFIIFLNGALSGNVSHQSGSVFGVGFATASGVNQSILGTSRHGITLSDTFRLNTNDRVITTMARATGGVQQTAIFNGFTEDGFILDWINSGNVDGQAYYAVIKGGTWSNGYFEKISGTGTQVVNSGVPFVSKGLFLMSNDKSGSPTGATLATSTHNRMSLGAASAPNSMAASWTGDEDARGNAQNAALSRGDAIYHQAYEEDVETDTVTNSVASLTSFDTSGFTLNWSVGDLSGASAIYYFAVGGGVDASSSMPARRAFGSRGQRFIPHEPTAATFGSTVVLG